MVNSKFIQKIILDLRFEGSDNQMIEIKESVGKLPSSLVKTLSAFANGSGGTIILGLSETKDFAPAKGFKAQPIADVSRTGLFRKNVTPNQV